MAKLSERKKDLRRSESGKVLKKQALRNIGIAVYVFGMFTWYQQAFGDYYYAFEMGKYFAFVFIAVGLLMIYRATRFNLQIDMYNQYYYWIYQNEMFTLQELAKASDKSEATIIREINSLINDGFLKNIHLNEKLRTVEGAFVTSVKEQIQRKVIRCSGCGARNEVVENETRECEYCGRKLVYNHK
ncbi:hypothetical protein G7061_10280 [Erysipelothrix sp. HDW6B]|uniref:hypothetical protein n=1 Tax=Erysipelothrix TaxID=1647 RepID=UPI001358F133|nr:MULTISPECIES: hypothetical protein [Erysipelothrix]QIK86974.1 hypothetical protein G7061_10280 [Erysipelothrix sp. HDW6B]